MSLKNKKVIVSGSLAYDYIMDFPGQFGDHIMADKTHELNVSFSINRLKESWGGTAGNIAYSLSLLGESPFILGVTGKDFENYRKWLEKNNIQTKYIKTFGNDHTASAYIITDKKDNQISGFYPGPADLKHCEIVEKVKDLSLAIISPEHKPRMIKLGRLYRRLGIPYIFDPGQQVISFNKAELKTLITGSVLTIGNDYEAGIMGKTLAISQKDLINLAKAFIITKGAQGSVLYQGSEILEQSAVLIKNPLDPTGAGDAYRAGIIKGLISGWPWPKTLRAASLLSSYAVQSYGTQEYRVSLTKFKKDYKKVFKETL